MAVPTPRLDRLAAMQDRPLGINTALYRDPATEAVGRDYRRTKEDYGMARRLLRRYARAGDPRAALQLVDLRDKARQQGITLGGLQNYQQEQSTIAERTGRLKRESLANEAATAGNLSPDAEDAPAPTPTTPTPTGPTAAAPMSRLGQLGRGYLEDAQVNQDLFDQGVADDMSASPMLRFRQGLDRAIGTATTGQEVSDLRGLASEAGVPERAFNRRLSWWERQRNRR